MAIKVATGTYTGNGLNNRAITGLGFSPKLVLIGPNAAGVRWVKFSSFDGSYAGRSFLPSDNGDLASSNLDNFIVSCDADGFTVSHNLVFGATNSANNSAQVYYWFAVGGDSTEAYAGKYTGNGVDGRSITGVGFQPGFVWVMGDANEYPVWKSTSTGTGVDLSSYTYDFMTGGIKSLAADGFTVGTSNRVNQNTKTYYYVAFKDVTGFFTSGTYTGNGADNRNITGVGFQPQVVWITGDPSSASYNYASWKTSDMAGDSALNFRLDALTADRIQSLAADGFQVGTTTNANANGITYYWLAMKNQTASPSSGRVSSANRVTATGKVSKTGTVSQTGRVSATF